jgi:hypothetical protein
LATQTRISGGLRETEVKPVAVNPVGPDGLRAATMVTPLAKWASASRKTALGMVSFMPG